MDNVVEAEYAACRCDGRQSTQCAQTRLKYRGAQYKQTRDGACTTDTGWLAAATKLVIINQQNNQPTDEDDSFDQQQQHNRCLCMSADIADFTGTLYSSTCTHFQSLVV